MRQVLAAALMLIGFGPGAAAQDNPVVVELFTSQGCSSCPPADAMLQDLARRDDVIALALHVDYWDYIGWADIFADPAHTERQRRYARAAGEKMIYTPQMVIGGRDHLVGTKPMELAEAIRAHLGQSTGVRLAIARTGDTLRIEARIEAGGQTAPARPLVVQLVRYDPEETVEIRKGENAGRTLTYANIVESWQILGQWDSGTTWIGEARVDGGDPIVVIVQERGPGAILAAAELD